MGKCYKGLENRIEAEKSFIKSLKINPSQIHVFEEFLKVKEGNWDDVTKLIDELSFEPTDLWLKDFYKLKDSKQALEIFMEYENKEKENIIQKEKNNIKVNKKIQIEGDDFLNPVLKTLIEKRNIEILYLKAESLFKNYELGESYKICKVILTLDSFHFKTLNIFSELLVERKVNLIKGNWRIIYDFYSSL